MAMEVIMQPASHGKGSMSNSENCNPNTEKEAVTPGKCTPKKTPVKAKTAALGEKSPVVRRLDCDEKSPGKALLLREAGASPHKHICRSARCAANNPDYAVPAPRQYLKSRRHLLAGWQPPLNSKLKTPTSASRGEDAGRGCNSNEERHAEEHHEAETLPPEPAVENVICDASPVGAIDEPDGRCTPQLEATNPVEEAVGDVKERTEPPSLSVSDSKDFNASMRGMSASTSSVGDMSLENAEVIETASRSGEVVNPGIADPCRASRTTDSDFSMRSIGEEGSDTRRLTCGSSRPPRRRYVRKGGRRLSIGTASNRSVSLHKQEGLKRKKAEEWMWDTAIKEAVQRLAPRVPGSVNVLVKAFESVKLTEEEIQRAKYKNSAIGRFVLKDSPFGAPEKETMASISKVRAWDESMAFVDEEKLRQDDESMAFTPTKSQARIPPFSRSEPPKVKSSRWATVSDESMTTKDDTYSVKGASSTSGKSRITDWTCGRMSQAGRLHKQKLKRCTSLHPFRLRTEERGAMKEYVFSKRLQQMWEEEERLRIPLAQGLPWTTEEPAVPPKPPVKEQTKAEGFKLITDVRAVERAEFDEYIAERQKQEELQRLEEERQRRVAEEEEVRRLRREMVPRAQLMPYFDRPFMPRRSSKKLTVPREPKFHLKQSKRPRCMASCNSSAA